MSVWPSQHGRLVSPRPFIARASAALSIRFESRLALWTGCLICILAAQGVAITQSYLWAAPLVCLLVIMLAIDIPLVPLLGLTMLIRVLTDNQASDTSRHSSSLNLSALIAGLYLLVAIGLLLHRRQGLLQVFVIALWLALWTAIAAHGHATSTLTVREGVREASIVALAAIAYNSRGVLSLSVVTRLIQLAGIASAVLAIYQLASHTGIRINGQARSSGTFAQPNVAAVYFAVAAFVSVWRYIDDGRRWLDAIFVVAYTAATIATFSLGGLASLLVMLSVFGLLRPGSFRLKLGGCAAATLVALAFLATPLGAEHLAQESSTPAAAKKANGEAKTSLGTRLAKWETLIIEWEQSPIIGQGLGATITAEDTSENSKAGLLPHNEYLRYLVETGVAGLIIALWGVYLLLGRMARRRFTEANNAGALGVALVVGLLVNAVAANTLLYTAASYAAALVVGSVLGSSADEVNTSSVEVI